MRISLGHYTEEDDVEEELEACEREGQDWDQPLVEFVDQEHDADHQVQSVLAHAHRLLGVLHACDVGIAHGHFETRPESDPKVVSLESRE